MKILFECLMGKDQSYKKWRNNINDYAIIPLLCFLFLLPNFSIAQCFENPPGSGNFVTALGKPCVNTIITAVPFLRLAVDARSGAMGEAGIALSPDANALHYNASKLVFADQKAGFALNYTPWLHNVVDNNTFLAYASGFYKIKEGTILGMGLKYFSLGDITYTDENGQPLQSGNSNELAFNLSYAQKISTHFSGSLGLKYISSDLSINPSTSIEEITPGKSVAVDFSFTYQNPALTIGLAVTNLGSKMTYTSGFSKDYIPTNLGLGIAWTKALGTNSSVTLTSDINKLLVPTPDFIGKDENLDGIPDYKQHSVIGGVFKSFGDAPGGFKEELRELMFSFGAEVWLKEIVALRTGYFTEHNTKGNREYLTMGLGLKYKFVNLNGSYLIPTDSSDNHPLKNTYRISLLFDIGEVEAD